MPKGILRSIAEEAVEGKLCEKRLEDEHDLRAWEEAKAEFDSDPVTISAAEIAGRYL